MSTRDTRPKNKCHGTIVARVIRQIAPWSNIINLKVADDNQEIRTKSILKALDYAYTNGIKIVNISLGKRGPCSNTCIVCSIINQMYDEGFAIVVAIGNFGREGQGIISCLATAEKAFAVGAVNPSKHLADYSSTAPPAYRKPNILAPGTVMVDGKSQVDGTSFAAPFVTGVVAALSNDFNIQYILNTIERTARSIGLPYNQQGHGLIHIEDLLGVIEDEKNATESQR
jgi:subtilisin family serine protease